MDVKAILIKLKPNSEKNIEAWQKEIKKLRDQAIQSIRNEDITVESWFKTEIAGEKYLLAYIRSNNIEKAHRIATESILEVDKTHQKFKKNCWEREGSIKFELLIDLSSS